MLTAIWTIVWRITQFASYAALIGYFLWNRTRSQGIPSGQPTRARSVPASIRKLTPSVLGFAVGVTLSSLAYGVIAPPLTRFGLRTLYAIPSYGVDLDKGIIAETSWEADFWLVEDPDAGFLPGDTRSLYLYESEGTRLIPVDAEPTNCAGYQVLSPSGMSLPEAIGSWFCFVTSEGASGRLFLEGITPGPVRLLKINYAILTLPSP